jgi:hypothetical protein
MLRNTIFELRVWLKPGPDQAISDQKWQALIPERTIPDHKSY